ncbi:MAG: tetratricopeptide repeat protein [Promethearchaeota archaeon]
MSIKESVPVKKKLTAEEIDKNIEKGIKFINKSYKFPDTPQNLQDRAEIASNVGFFYTKKDNYEGAQKYFQLALREYDKLKDDQKVAATKGALGSLYIHNEKYLVALSYMEESYNYWKTTNFLNERIACLQNLGIINLKLKEEVKASEFILEALKKSIQLQDEDQFATSIQILLNYYEPLDRYDMLLELKKKALEFWVKMNLLERQFKTLIDVGVLSQVLEDFSQAVVYFKKAFNIGYQNGNLEKMYLAQGFLAETFLKLEEIEKAKHTYLQTYKLAVYINTIKDFKEQVQTMKTTLLVLGFNLEEIIAEGEKAQKEAEKDK